MPLALPLRPVRSLRHAPPAAGGTELRTLAIIGICTFVLYEASEVFIPLVLAVLLAFVLSPIIRVLRRWRVPRVPAILVAVLLALGVIGALGAVIGVQLVHLAQRAPELEATAKTKIDELEGGPLGRVVTFVHDVNAALRESKKNLPTATATPAAKPDAAVAKEKPLLVRLDVTEDSPLTIAKAILGPVVSPISMVGIVLVVVVFLLLQREDLRDRMIRLFGSGDFKATTDALDDAGRRLSLYFLAQVGVNATFGLIIGTGLALIGVPSPVLWGVIAMLLRFVPYIGSLLSAALPITLASTVAPGWGLAIKTAALFAVIEGVTGQVIEPLLYGRSTGLSPFAVVVAAMFWGWLWGPIGLILSTPFTVALVVLGRHVRHLQFLDVMLGDEPALTPTENFYQRILAGDVDEARDHAEHMLATRTLCAYHDDVTLSAMRLAIGDIERGALSGDALARVKASLHELVGELALRDRARPEADRPTTPDTTKPRLPGRVLCVAGRGILDEEAAAILVQLLESHGLTAALVPYDEVSRRRILALDTESVAAVCVVHVEVGDPSPYLHYLLERVRARLRGAKVILGLWAPGQERLDEARCRQLGADSIACSLGEALDACREAMNGASGKVAAE